MLMLVLLLILTILNFIFDMWNIFFWLLILNMYMILSLNSCSYYFYLHSLVGLDTMSYMLMLLSIWISILMLIAMFKMGMNKNKMFYFYILMMLWMLGMCFSMTNMLNFYIFFEGVLIPMILLIFSWGGQPERLQAGVYMLMYTLFGSLPLLLTLLALNKFISLSFFFFFFLKIKNVSLTMILTLMLAFLIKMPIYMFHLWLPKAHVEAPVAGSMILAGVLLKLGGYGILRMSLIFNNNYCSWDIFFIAVSLIGAIFICMLCLRQIDIKSLIAYSSVCHMGLVISSLMGNYFWSIWGTMIMMLGHGMCSSALFYMSNLFYERVFTRNILLLSGLQMIFPYMMFWWFLMLVINMGAPPFMNLIGEILLIGSILKWSILSLIFLMFISFLSAGYCLYLYSMIQHGKFMFYFSVEVMTCRELMLIWLHLFPLIGYVLKLELFLIWF